jgi:hypothetical protein
MAAGVGLYTRLPPYTEWMRKIMISPLPVYPTSTMSHHHGDGTFIFALLVLLIVIS